MLQKTLTTGKESATALRCKLADPGGGGGSVGSRNTAAKVFKNDRASPWDATLNDTVPRLIPTLVSDWAQNIFLCPTEASIYRCFHGLSYTSQTGTTNSRVCR